MVITVYASFYLCAKGAIHAAIAAIHAGAACHSCAKRNSFAKAAAFIAYRQNNEARHMREAFFVNFMLIFS